MRNASGGKFSLGSAFGRKADRHPSYSGNDFAAPNSPQAQTNQSYSNGDEPSSPGVKEGGTGPTFDGLGKKLGKTFAHQSLLPSLGNKDVRALQDVISTEKGVLNSSEKLAAESAKAASALPNYGLQEGPDLHDILTQSSVLLNHLSSSLNTFAERQTSLRTAFKRIREREEALLELRSRRRNTGNKAETAEKKLAKMGPENKALPSQTELLESLRHQMRSMDTEIVNEESRIGDFKRQTVKEALSYKFAGLEELGEKMCIIGELGKLVIEEIPLDETPAGYGRVPYTGFAKTESAVEEAGRCLSQVKFNPVNYELKTSHLPKTQHSLGRSELPGQESLAAAEEFGNAPLGDRGDRAAQPNFALDDNPYGGLEGRYGADNNAYREYGGLRTEDSSIQQAQHAQATQGHVVWQGPTEEALAKQNTGAPGEYGRERIASMYQQESSFAPTPPGPGAVAGADHADYEYQQQAEMDRQNREEQDAWKDQREHVQAETGDTHSGSPAAPNPPATATAGTEIGVGQVMPNPYAPESNNQSWQPLNIRRGDDGPPRLPNPVDAHQPYANKAMSSAAYDYDAAPAPPVPGITHSYAQDVAAPTTDDTDLAPPPSFAHMGVGSGRATTPSDSRDGQSGTEGFRTPLESPNLASETFALAPIIPVAPFHLSQDAINTTGRTPSPLPPVPGIQDPAQRGPSPRPPFDAAGAGPTSPTFPTPGGKISAGAFRKPMPRRSDTQGTQGTLGTDDADGEIGRMVRRLPAPPGAPSGSGSGFGAGPSSGVYVAGGAMVGAWPDEKRALQDLSLQNQNQTDHAAGQTQTQTTAQSQPDNGAFEDANGDHDAPPPSYPVGDSLR